MLKFQTFGLQFNEELVFQLFCKLIRYSISSESIALDKCKYQLLSNKYKKVKEISFLPYICCALYILITVFSHSCDPNACQVFNVNKIKLRDIKPIAIDEEITISYAFQAVAKSQRQEELRVHYYISCKCIRCEFVFDNNIYYQKLKDPMTKRRTFAKNFEVIWTKLMKN